MMRWHDGGWFLGGTLMVLLVAAVVVIAVTLLMRPSERRQGTDSAGESWRAAERELEMRFARGEIDADTLVRGRMALRDRSG